MNLVRVPILLAALGLSAGSATTYSESYENVRLAKGRHFVTVEVNQYSSRGEAMIFLKRRSKEVCAADGFDRYELTDVQHGSKAGGTYEGTGAGGTSEISATVVCRHRRGKAVASGPRPSAAAQRGQPEGESYDEYDRFKKRRTVGVRDMSFRASAGPAVLLHVEAVVEEAGKPSTPGELRVDLRFEAAPDPERYAECGAVDFLVDDNPFAPPVAVDGPIVVASLTLDQIDRLAQARTLEARVCGDELAFEARQIGKLKSFVTAVAGMLAPTEP